MARPSSHRRAARLAPDGPTPSSVSLAEAVERAAFSLTGHRLARCSVNEAYLAVASVVRDRLLERAVDSLDGLAGGVGTKRVAYLSAEFLIGPQLVANLLALDLLEPMRTALSELGLDLDDVVACEEEPGLGNGGLGRLAACFMESMATTGITAVGYGIRYEFGIFDQALRGGWQVEVADKWLHWGNPWEIARPELTVQVGFGGTTRLVDRGGGGTRVVWEPAEIVRGVPHDTPILGYRVAHATVLRLWRAEAEEALDLQAFNRGDYMGAVEAKVRSETISKVLYPNDNSAQGRELRLKQQFFFVSSSLQDMLRLHHVGGERPLALPERWAVQLNDTHPALAVAELMRLLVDDHDVPWDAAWDATVRTCGYTNHTLLPEALETWPVELFGRLLPRHLEIVYEINRRHLDLVRERFPYDPGRVTRLSLIDERGGRSVRMAHLACAGCHTVNGVAELHTALLKQYVLSDWVALHPNRFVNVTNGVTPRRFLAQCNPGLTALISEAIGERWIADLSAIGALEAVADDDAFQARWQSVAQANKRRLAELIRTSTGLRVDATALFDVHVKRIHEYKRQHLNVLNILAAYARIKANPGRAVVPRVHLFAGKAAPGYTMAKLMIRLITATAALVNGDREVDGRLTVVFLPDFNVSQAQRIYPAADVSEQISTAGKEASGTGNMKLAMNGALTIGTLDGANIEIRDLIGTERFVVFGLTAPAISGLRASGYRPRDHYETDDELAGAVDLLSSRALTGGERGLFAPIVNQLLGDDPYMLMADFRSYVEAQTAVDGRWRRPATWTRQAIETVARMGHFSSDRSVADYAARVWTLPSRDT